MKKTLFFSFLLILSCKSAEFSKGERNEVESCQIANYAFKSGEKLTYKLTYTVAGISVAAGEVTFNCDETAEQYHIVAHGKTYPSYEKIFKVDDFYESYLDKKTLLPQTSIREVHEGKYNLYDKIIFDQKNHKATSHRGDFKDKTNPTDYKIETCMHDLISIIYFSRNLDFQHLAKNTYFPISIFMDGKAHPLEVFYKGNEKNMRIKGIGKVDTQIFSAQTISGRTFEEEAIINIYVSDDQNRTPLMIESPLSVGSVRAILKK